uniref:Uncharacterized protein n=1 Tax=Rhizophora mucronata TaxID=61149 RepID=A0A2P2NWG5_RHIMU
MQRLLSAILSHFRLRSSIEQPFIHSEGECV